MASEPTWDGIKFLNFRGEDAPRSPISFCTSRGSSYKRGVPMLCPSNGDVLAKPLHKSFSFADAMEDKGTNRERGPRGSGSVVDLSEV